MIAGLTATRRVKTDARVVIFVGRVTTEEKKKSGLWGWYAIIALLVPV